MIETWTALEVVGGLVIVGSVFGPMIYAWADRWLDRTRNVIRDEVVTGEQRGE